MSLMNKNIYKGYKKGQAGCIGLIIIFWILIMIQIFKHGIN